VIAGNFLDQFGLAEPLFVGPDFVLGHGGQGVHFLGKAADGRKFGDKVHESEKGSAPGLDKHDAAVASKHAPHFGKSLIEVVRQSGEMVEPTLHDEEVFAAIGERKLAAIGDGALRRAFELRKEAGRKVDTFDAGEAEALQSNEAVTATAKKFDDFRVPRPLRSAQAIESRDKLLDLLFGRFEAQVCSFPWIWGEGVLNLRVRLVFGRIGL